jgi:hypothetical protein
MGWSSFDGPGGGTTTPPPPPTTPHYTLSGSYNGKPVQVGASNRFGAAVYSLVYDGFQYLDSSDHGRELQTAWQLDGMGEGQNPTEAGSAANGAGTTSSTRVLAANVNGMSLSTRVNPAYWLTYNGQVTSPHYLEKTVRLDGNVLRHDVGMYLASPYHTTMAVEGLTAYTPTSFTRCFTFDYGGTNVTEIAPGPLVASTRPVMLSNSDTSRAIALIGGDRSHLHWIGRIGAWPKIDASWFSVSNPSGWYRWTTFTVVGNTNDVLSTASRLPT